MFFSSIKEINSLRKEINRLLSKRLNRFNKEKNRLLSKGINRSRKGVNRLLTKEMWSIYIKITIEKNWRSQNSKF